MFFDKAKAEISRTVDLDTVPIRVIALPQHENPMISATYEDAFEGVWTQLAAREANTCALTGQVHPPVDVAPKAVIMDVRIPLPSHRLKEAGLTTVTIQFFAAKAFTFLRRTAPEVKVYTWYPSAALSGLYLFGPESLGGRGNLLVKAEADAAETGKPFDIVATEVRFRRPKVYRAPEPGTTLIVCNQSCLGKSKMPSFECPDCLRCTITNTNLSL